MTQKDLLDKFGTLIMEQNFRNEFLKDPKTALEKNFAGATLPKNVEVHQNSVKEMHIILLPAEKVVYNDALETKVEEVLDKALVDASFKKMLMADPKGTLTKELPDFYIPGDFKVYFHENTEDTMHLVVPALANESEELSEAELDSVAGGGGHKGPHIGRPRGGKGPKCRSQHFSVRR